MAGDACVARACVFFAVMAVAAMSAVAAPSDERMCVLSEAIPGIVATPEETELRICSQHSSDSCCTQQYVESIVTWDDPISRNLTMHGTAGSECEDLFTAIACIACSGSQDTWVDVHSWGITIDVCTSFCDQLFETCADEIVGVGGQFQRVSAAFESGDDMCHGLFEADSPFQLVPHSRDSEDCWDNTVECTADDYYPQYSACDRVANTRTLSYIKKPSAECKGGYRPPPPATGLPCAITCEEGEFLPVGGTQCVQCSAGSFSLGGGERIEIWERWEDIDLPFRTFCTEYNDAKVLGDCGWVLDGEFINSGVRLNDSMSSYLELSVTLVRDGHVRFSFSVDAEARYDGLTFLVNHDVIMSKVSQQPTFREVVLPLEQGHNLLQWVFSKDNSVSRGDDIATIELIEVDGIAFADSDCDVCPVGQAAPDRGARICEDCAADTYAPKTGMAECMACPEGRYSYEGSGACKERPECGGEHWYSYYTPCAENANGDVSRTERFEWLQPKICEGGEALPGDVTGKACAPCSAGLYRPVGDAQCLQCPAGQYSPANATQCSTCHKGSFTRRELVLDTFAAWDHGLATSCTFNCGTEGWRLLYDRTDSGVGHGHFAESVLTLTQEVVDEHAEVSFVLTLLCSERCELTFSDNDTVSRLFVGGPGSFFTPVEQRYTFPVRPGVRQFSWRFVKIDPHEISRDDRAEIELIELRGSAVGGATECVECAPGTYSPNGVECLVAPAGYYAEAGADRYSPCPDGQFNREAGQGECVPCGAGTHTAPDRKSCTFDCHFSPPSAPGVEYDLTPLRSETSMHGPVYDEHHQAYYINVCTTHHRNTTCYDTSGEAIATFACQVTTHLYSEDIGDVIGFTELPEDPAGGLVVHMTHGNMCPPEGGSPAVERTTDVRFLCDPAAGTGQLEAGGDGEDVVEGPRCHYSLEWRTAYACPLCTEQHYHFLVTECVGDGDGAHRVKLYDWNENPKRCHGGVSLPANESIPCTSWGLPCPAGQYLDTSGVEGSCRDAPRGHYSIGGGVEYDEWGAWPEGFKNGDEHGWTLQHDALRSGLGDTFFFTTQNFYIDGSVSFEYKVYSAEAAEEHSGLQFFVDEQPQTPLLRNTEFDYREVTVPVSAGARVLKWVFTNGAAGDGLHRERGARIRRITILNEPAALAATPCEPGTFAAHSKQEECDRCPRNTFAAEPGATRCDACADDEYALPGSAACVKASPCSADDFQEVYTPCGPDGTRRTFVPLDPQVCRGEYQPSAIDQDPPVPCFPCRAGFFRPAGEYECTSCDAGFYYDEAAGSCTVAKAGTYSKLQIGFFDQPESEWPQGFATKCSGECGSSGWRVRGDNADSGYHDGEVDSTLMLTITLAEDGWFSFEYLVEAPAGAKPSNGLELFVDGEQQSLVYHPSAAPTRAADDVRVQFWLAGGRHLIEWNYHQEAAVTGKAVISNIVVVGATNGGAVGEAVCPPGTKSGADRALECDVCPPGTYAAGTRNTECTRCSDGFIAEHPGTSACTPCGEETHSSADHMSCVVPCNYTISGRHYDLHGLSNRPGPYSIPSRDSEIYITMCSQSDAGGCKDHNGAPLSTHACETYGDGQSVDVGRVPGVSFGVQRGDEQAIRVEFSEGDSAGCSGISRETELFLICDMTANESDGPHESADSPVDNICFISLEWRTPFACPLCTSADYETQVSDCEDGWEETARVRINDECFGPLIDGEVSREKCTKSYAIPLAAIILALVVIVVLAVCVVVVCVQHRRVSNRYSLLVSESSKQYEMETLDNAASPQA